MVKISIVTLSFNQGRFLEQAIKSVLEQDYDDIEYIVVDPGSRDGSRETIEKYRSRISNAIFEPDYGPADGLNKGFATATGEIYGFLNADDYLLPGALRTVATFFSKWPIVDVMSGHVVIVDSAGGTMRYCYSDRFDLKACAYGQCILMQPSTFFRAAVFNRSRRFNPANRSNWDGELWVDLALEGADFSIINSVLSAYRVHEGSITGSGKLDERIAEHSDRMFRRIVQRKWRWYDRVPKTVCWVTKHLKNPRNLGQRALRGPVYRAG
jgi:glycosyltransferase involved in cell wall biosynthesis